MGKPYCGYRICVYSFAVLAREILSMACATTPADAGIATAVGCTNLIAASFVMSVLSVIHAGRLGRAVASHVYSGRLPTVPLRRRGPLIADGSSGAAVGALSGYPGLINSVGASMTLAGAGLGGNSVPSALTHLEGTGSLSSLARIEAAGAFQTNGFGSALCSGR